MVATETKFGRVADWGNDAPRAWPTVLDFDGVMYLYVCQCHDGIREAYYCDYDGNEVRIYRLSQRRPQNSRFYIVQ